MNDFVIFGSTGLTGGYFLDEVKNRNLKYHLFVREVSITESIENQTLFDSENLPDLPNAKSLVICIGYPLKFLELIYMKLNVRKEFKSVDLDLVIQICKKAVKAGISNVLIISAVGANNSSLNYYLKIKGVMATRKMVQKTRIQKLKLLPQENVRLKKRNFKLTLR